MTSLTLHTHVQPNAPAVPSTDRPRFGGILRRLSRLGRGFTLAIAGRRWNPLFAQVLHRGRRSGRSYVTPVAARRVGDGFIISLAFGAHVDWSRNLVAAGGGEIRWRGSNYGVGSPETIDVDEGRVAFNVVQRLALRLGGIGGYIRVPDTAAAR